MEESKRISIWGIIDRVSGLLRGKLIAGIAVLVPAVVTFLALRIVFRWLDGLAQPVVKQMLRTDTDIPGLGVVLTVLVIWIAGLFAGNVFGRRLIRRSDKLVDRIPIIGSIYRPARQFIENVLAREGRSGFHRVVLAEYPSDGRWILGFATGDIDLDGNGTVGRCVFVPTSPNPATGWTVIFPAEKVRDTPLTVEEAMQLIVSAGLVVPESLEALGDYGLAPEGLRLSNIDSSPSESPT